jgi:hypothetical protein
MQRHLKLHEVHEEGAEEMKEVCKKLGGELMWNGKCAVKLKELDSEMKLRKLDPNEEDDKFDFEQGYRYRGSFGFPESIGEQGNTYSDFTYKLGFNKDEIKNDIIEKLKEEKHDMSEQGFMGARDERILKILRRIKLK